MLQHPVFSFQPAPLHHNLARGSTSILLFLDKGTNLGWYERVIVRCATLTSLQTTFIQSSWPMPRSMRRTLARGLETPSSEKEGPETPSKSRELFETPWHACSMLAWHPAAHPSSTAVLHRSCTCSLSTFHHGFYRPQVGLSGTNNCRKTWRQHELWSVRHVAVCLESEWNEHDHVSQQKECGEVLRKWLHMHGFAAPSETRSECWQGRCNPPTPNRSQICNSALLHLCLDLEGVVKIGKLD